MPVSGEPIKLVTPLLPSHWYADSSVFLTLGNVRVDSRVAGAMKLSVILSPSEESVRRAAFESLIQEMVGVGMP